MSRNYLNNLIKLRDHIESKSELIGVKYFDDDGGCCAVGSMFELTRVPSICNELKNISTAFYALDSRHKDELRKYFEDDFIGLIQECNDEFEGRLQNDKQRKTKVIAMINIEIDRVKAQVLNN